MKIYKAFYLTEDREVLIGYFRTESDAKKSGESLKLNYYNIEVVPYYLFESFEEYNKYRKEEIIKKIQTKLSKEELEALGI